MKCQPIEWGNCQLEDGETKCFTCGRILVRCRRSGSEIVLSSRSLNEGESDEIDDGEDIPWTRWAVSNEVESIEFRPRLPNLPILVEPENPFNVVPGAEARIFVSVPVSVVVLAKGGADHELTEFPTEVLSQTWFGETDSGEVCYSLSSPANREKVEQGDDSHVEAPVTIRNEAVEVLEVKRICLRVDGLAIHRKDGRLWTNETLLKFQGGPKASHIEVIAGPPKEAVGGERLAQARELGARAMVARTFRSLRRWTSELFD